MEQITVKPIERGRIWLPIQYGQNEVRFAYPPVQGTHQECFQALAKDEELRPAKGLDHALLTYGAYNGKDKEWKDVRQTSFVSNYIRMPSRMLLIPVGHIQGDASLSGVLFEDDVAGVGLSTQMQIPDLSKWAQKKGIYRSPHSSALFIPNVAYEGKSFEQDGIAQAHLTPEGATLFAQTAQDAGKTLYNRIVQRMKEITVPEPRVSLGCEDSGELGLDGGGCGWYDNRYGRAFGVFPTGEARTQKF